MRKLIVLLVFAGALVSAKAQILPLDKQRLSALKEAYLHNNEQAAVSTFTRSMAKELGPDGIRVNAVCPGTIATSFHDIFNTPENRERMKGNYPLRREGQADEVADLVCYLASDEASYITGANIDINGGVFFS